jgi:hypothetical protein
VQREPQNVAGLGLFEASLWPMRAGVRRRDTIEA